MSYDETQYSSGLWPNTEYPTSRLAWLEQPKDKTYKDPQNEIRLITESGNGILVLSNLAKTYLGIFSEVHRADAPS
ncbi:MAG: hypothetical protein ACXABY_11710 [Candidatus Thorarchaeota archaeon]|jgi:hypothetical protein